MAIKKETKKPAAKKLAAKKEVIPVNTDTTITRDGYVLHFVKPKDAKKVNDLVNTGKIVDNVAISCSTDNDKIDELIFVVKN